MNKKYDIFFNATLFGGDMALGILGLLEKNYIMGSVLIILGIAFGWLGWSKLNE